MNDLAKALKGVLEDALEVFVAEDEISKELVKADKTMEVSNLDGSEVHRWIKTVNVPEGAKILDTVRGFKRKCLDVRAFPPRHERPPL